MAGLTQEQRARYEEDGYLVLPGVFNRREVAQMAAEATRLAQWQVSISLALGTPTPRLDVQRRGPEVVLRTIRPVNDVSPVFTKYANDERLLRPLRELLDAEPVLMEEKLHYQQVLPGRPEVVTGADADADESFPFPTDHGPLWLDGEPPEARSAIAIDANTADNGPFCVVPGSHTRDGTARRAEAVPVLCPAGSIVLLHPALAHSSSVRRIDEPRRVLLLSHRPETREAGADTRHRELRLAGQAAEDRYEELVYSGASVPEYRLR
jgi:ectoine hydroxylase-related dioxygenase (phytanoyl-CoA dioxygenase family)